MKRPPYNSPSRTRRRSFDEPDKDARHARPRRAGDVPSAPRPSPESDEARRVSHPPQIESRDAEQHRANEGGAQLYGVSPVLEVLRAASRPIERITLAEGVHEARLREL
ncbi:MAG: hypothetical protein WCD76_07185, partial [Pyrinomonadaceae bacterium]